MVRKSDPEMTAQDVIEILQLLNQHHVDVCIDGGWGVDALLGEQTRAHADLDIAVQHKDVPRIRTLLEARGYRDVPRDDTRDCNFVLGDDRGHEIDIHSYTFDSAGDLVFGVAYPYDSLNGTGIVNGYPVKCISPEWMVKFHSGYKLDEKDYQDVKALCQRFDIQIPAEYEEFERQNSTNMGDDSIASGFKDPKRMVEHGYDQVAHDYARLEGETEWPRMRWLKKVLNELQPGSSVLDLGCGSGDPADIEIAREHKVTGVDISQTQIHLARQRVPAGSFLHGDAGSVEFDAASFDAVVSFYTLEHIPREEHETILRRIHHWLRPGGLLLISMEAGDYEGYFGEWLGVPMFMSCFDPKTMKQLVNKAGFELLESAIENQTEQGHPVPYHWIFARKTGASSSRQAASVTAPAAGP